MFKKSANVFFNFNFLEFSKFITLKGMNSLVERKREKDNDFKSKFMYGTFI